MYEENIKYVPAELQKNLSHQYWTAYAKNIYIYIHSHHKKNLQFSQESVQKVKCNQGKYEQNKQKKKVDLEREAKAFKMFAGRC